MPGREPYWAFIERFEAAGLPYCITGSVAATVYGEMRFTADIDVVTMLGAGDLAKLSAAFPEADFYLPPAEMLLLEINRAQRGAFNVIDQASMFKADIFLAGSDPLQHWALENRRRLRVGPAGEASFAPPEYVILRKLEYFREGEQAKHIQDIRLMLACTEVDADFLQAQVQRLGLQEQWNLCQSRAA
jgi:hypothetical protein